MSHDDLIGRIAALEDELARLKAEVRSNDTEPSSRRDMVKKLVIAGAGVAAGAVAMARPAAADDGDVLFLGMSTATDDNNIASTRTRLVYNGPALVVPEPASVDTNFFQLRDDTLTQYQPETAGFTSLVNTKAHSAIYGYSQIDGNGVFGFSESGVGVLGWGRGGVGGQFQGGLANLMVTSFGPPPPQRTDAHSIGEVVHDENGDLWFCVASGTPGTWRQLSGAATAGQLHLLAAPVRVYDSRAGSPADGALAGGSQRVVSLASGTSGGASMAAVPAGAVGALVSLTLDATADSGFLALYANGVTPPGNSNINWYTDGQIVAVTTVTAVDAQAKAVVEAGGPGATQFVVDVIGYYA